MIKKPIGLYEKSSPAIKISPRSKVEQNFNHFPLWGISSSFCLAVCVELTFMVCAQCLFKSYLPFGGWVTPVLFPPRLSPGLSAEILSSQCTFWAGKETDFFKWRGDEHCKSPLFNSTDLCRCRFVKVHRVSWIAYLLEIVHGENVTLAIRHFSSPPCSFSVSYIWRDRLSI